MAVVCAASQPKDRPLKASDNFARHPATDQAAFCAGYADLLNEHHSSKEEDRNHRHYNSTNILQLGR
jgi:hypothetical protein